MASLVVEWAVDFESDLLTDTALGSAVSSGGPWRSLWSFPGAGGVWLGTVLGTALDETTCLDKRPDARDKIVYILFDS